MRIGIVTFWQSGDNYGQQLQCWALQRYLKGIGHEPFLIRYLYKEPLWRKCLKLMAKTVLVYPLLRWWRHREVRRMEAVNRVKNKERRFEEFRKSHIYQTQRIYGSLKELRKDPPTADLYITGSDQVWHPVLLRRKDDRAYWLDFGSDRIRRIAYAASFGSDQCPLRLQAELTARLSRFDILGKRRYMCSIRPCCLRRRSICLFHEIYPQALLLTFLYIVSIFQVMRRYVGRSFEVSQRERDYRWW